MAKKLKNLKKENFQYLTFFAKLTFQPENKSLNVSYILRDFLLDISNKHRETLTMMNSLTDVCG